MGALYGATPGRVQEGGTPPTQLGSMGEHCKLPHWGLGRNPRSQCFLRLKKLQKLYKKEVYSGGQEAYSGGQEAYRGNQEAYRGGQEAYRGGQEAYRGDQKA